MQPETTIYLLRHAHAEWREDEGRPLSSDGIKAADLVAERLAGRPIVAVYTSPSRRSVETVEPLSRCLGLRPAVVPDLRERELPAVPPEEFEALVREAWSAPDQAPRGGESNVLAQIRGLAVVRTVAERHVGSQAVLATHGNLLALVLNALDRKFAYEFWRGLSFPDIYQLTFAGAELRRVERVWQSVEETIIGDASVPWGNRGIDTRILVQPGAIETRRLRLVPKSLAEVRAQIDVMNADQRAEVSSKWLAQLDAATVDLWTLGFAIVDRGTDAVVGTCGFKGPPGADGIVEIAYGVTPEEQGKGYATEATEALVSYAFGRDQVRIVRAHTFEAANASARVLTKCRFKAVGEVIDPEDGLVWRWERHQD